MSWHPRVFAWLERASDWLNPIVVKEVRQFTGGREFHSSFGVSLMLGLCVAFFGAAEAISATGTPGRWTFGALIGCLAFFGLVVVPLGAFNALRTERLEQTLELITLTTLSTRRVVIGKLLAQGVKLATLFAGLAPFIAMSFLLGGIDFVTILVSMLVLFSWALWVCAVSLFLSSLIKTRAISGLMFGAVGLMFFLVVVILGVPQVLFFVLSRGGVGSTGVSVGFVGGSLPWWVLAMATTFCLVSMMNLVLLAENRLSVPSENRVTPLRVGFAAQFLLLVAWVLSFIGEPVPTRTGAAEALAVLGGLHLALVAMFTVTEDLVLPRRVAMRMQEWSPVRQMLAILSPGGGRGALYVIAQMVILLAAVRILRPSGAGMGFSFAVCGYICFFSGVPVAAFRLLRPAAAAAFQLRVAVLVSLPLVMALPDILYYMLWRPYSFDINFATRHLINPFRTLANWPLVESKNLFAIPVVMGLIGVAAYSIVIGAGLKMTVESAIESSPSAPAREPGRADVY
ncbi:MAG TPA: hypothetical protein VKB50_28035 [Vicinamibacterales bacterium]|nr:hypothetical protein [Vicinamibacterales bacterium]